MRPGIFEGLLPCHCPGFDRLAFVYSLQAFFQSVHNIDHFRRLRLVDRGGLVFLPFSLSLHVGAPRASNCCSWGPEFGQRSEWSQENGLDWAALAGPREAGLRRLIDDLKHGYRQHAALWRNDFEPGGFSWIDANDAMGNVISFLRFDEDGPPLACVVNFSGEPHYDYRVGLPKTGLWREAINTDVTEYGGSGVGNLGSVQATAHPWHGRPASRGADRPAALDPVAGARQKPQPNPAQAS